MIRLADYGLILTGVLGLPAFRLGQAERQGTSGIRADLGAGRNPQVACKVTLWTKADGVTYFDTISITPLN